MSSTDNHIKYAGIAGIIFLVLLAPVAIFEIVRSVGLLGGIFVWLYVFVLFLSLVLTIIFLWGFKLVSEKFQDNLLGISSYIWIVSVVISSGYLILTVISPDTESNVGNVLAGVIWGVVAVPFGISLLKLKPLFGPVAIAAGVISIIMGISTSLGMLVIFDEFTTSIVLTLVLIALLLLALSMLIPFYILTSIIFSRATKKS